MPSNQTKDQKLSDRANELYWRSRQSVNQIAEEMDLSKSRLYGLVRPLPAASACPECQGELRFPNRTAMEKGFVSCSECEFEGAVPEEGSVTARAAAPKAQKASKTRAASEPAPAGRRLSSQRVLWGSALLGLAAGLYLASRQRRS